MDIVIIRIVSIILTALIALGIGLILRRLLVRRLKHTVLDNWLIQMLGVIVVIFPLLVAAPVSLVIANDVQIFAQVNLKDAISLGWNALETLFIIALGIGIARTLATLAMRSMGESRLDINIRTLIKRLFYIVILTLVGFWVLSIWQVSIGVPVAALGVLTVALTVAVQDVLKDLFAGFYILIERPFRIGDQITIGDQLNQASRTGRVEDVQIRATKLRLVSGEEVTVPNALVFGSIVINNTFYGERRATISVSLPEEDFVKDETPEQLLKILKGIEAILVKPEPSVRLSSFSDRKVTLFVSFWVAQGQASTVSEAMHVLHAALPNADLVVQEAAGNV